MDRLCTLHFHFTFYFNALDFNHACFGFIYWCPLLILNRFFIELFSLSSVSPYTFLKTEAVVLRNSSTENLVTRSMKRTNNQGDRLPDPSPVKTNLEAPHLMPRTQEWQLHSWLSLFLGKIRILFWIKLFLAYLILSFLVQYWRISHPWIFIYPQHNLSACLLSGHTKIQWCAGVLQYFAKLAISCFGTVVLPCPALYFNLS